MTDASHAKVGNGSAGAGSKARYVMVGGFLGAGKTTAVARFAKELTDRGLRVGLITNDQSSGLVDTAILRARGFDVEEIAGGCFCCRFDSLSQAADNLEKESRPDVFLAEPVGSCTDLVATVSYPLRRIYGDRFEIAPLSVLVDPVRAARILGLREGRSFSEKVVYVYEKQLEEADLIVVNKVDTVGRDELHALVEALRARFPRAEVLCASAKEGVGCDEWLERVMTGRSPDHAVMDLDYDVYAEGEALLGWLNATFSVDGGGTPFDGNQLLLELTRAIRERLDADGLEIAHLKLTLDGAHDGALSVVSTVGSHDEPDLRESLVDLVDRGSLILNLRAEADPEILKLVAMDATERVVGAASGRTLKLEHAEHFRPAYPTPTHRFQ